MKQGKMIMAEREYDMEVGSPHFDIRFVKDLKNRLSLVISWTRDTQFPNFVHMRLITIHMGSPWYTHITCYTNTD